MKSLLRSTLCALFLTSLVVTATPRMPVSTQQNVDGLGYSPNQPSVISQSVCWSPAKKTPPMKPTKDDMPMSRPSTMKDEMPMSPMKTDDNYETDCKLCRLLELMKAIAKNADDSGHFNMLKPRMSRMKRVRYYDYDEDRSGDENSDEKYGRPNRQPNRYRTNRYKYKSYNDNSEESDYGEWTPFIKDYAERSKKPVKGSARLRKYDWETSDSVESPDTLVIPQSYSDRRRKRYQR